MYDRTPQPYPTIRPSILDALDLYAKEGRPVGNFLQAVLANNLLGAVGHADPVNSLVLRAITIYVHNELPHDCHGSPFVYDQHVGRMAKARQADRPSVPSTD